MTTGSFPPFNFENVSLPERLSGRMKWVAAAAIVVVLLIVLSLVRGIYADWLWFGELGYRGVFVKVILTKAILFAVGFSTGAIFVGASLLTAYKASFGPVSVSIPDSALSLTRKAVLVDVRLDDRVERAVRNLPTVRFVRSNRLTARDVVHSGQVVLSRAAVEHLAQVLGK